MADDLRIKQLSCCVVLVLVMSSVNVFNQKLSIGSAISTIITVCCRIIVELGINIVVDV